MKEREAAAAGLLVFIALLRMLAPALPFDWMTLALVLAAAFVIWADGQRPPRRPAENPKGYGPFEAEPAELFVPREMDALRPRMERVTWRPGENGLFSALQTLRLQKPFAAMCAARGMLLMLMEQTKVSGEDADTLSLLLAAMDSVAAAGEGAADAGCV
ncbi:MAG: hypothetical protein FWF69_04425, partial [Firmicutes bacterium]|nr:hypothetical protein [Bacillota bacterium]